MAAKKIIRSFSSMFIKSPSPSLSLFSSSSSSASRHRLISDFASLNLGLGSPGRSSFSCSPSNPDYDPRAGAQILEGCDYQHWFVVVDTPDEGTLRENIIADYIRILATVVGSEEVACEKMYSVSTNNYFAFGALLSEEVANKLREVAKVRYVLPDSYLDAKNQDYGGEPFTEGKAAPYDRKYHAVWEQNDQERRKRFKAQLRQQQQRGPQHVASPVGQLVHGRGTNQQHIGSPQDEALQFGHGRGAKQQQVGSPQDEALQIGRGRGAKQQQVGSPLSEVSQFGYGEGPNQQHVRSPQGEVRQLGRGRGATPNLSNQHPTQNWYSHNRYQQQNSSSADKFGSAPNQFENKNSRNQDY